MKKILISGAIYLAIANSITAQIQSPTDYTKVMDKAMEAFGKGELKTSLELLRSVPDGDSNYYVAQYEIGLALLQDSSYKESIKHNQELLLRDSSEKLQILLNIANAYDYLGDKENSNAYYAKVQQLYPHSHRPYYELAVAAFRRKDYDAAEKHAQQSFLINPYHYKSTLMLGYVYFFQGRLSESFLALSTSMALTDKEEQEEILMALHTLANVNDEVLEHYKNKSAKHAHELFSEIDELIYAKLALINSESNKDYKNRVVRVLKMIVEKVSFDNSDTNFVMQTYIPLYEQFDSKDRFKELVHLLFGNYREELELGKTVNHDVARNRFVDMLNLTASTRQKMHKDKTLANVQYIYIPKGNVLIEAKPTNLKFEDFQPGYQKYYKNGILLIEGTMGKNSKKEGVWKSYYTNGVLKSIENYKNGEQVGIEYQYNDKGVLTKEITRDASGNFLSRKDYNHAGVLLSSQEMQGKTKLMVMEYFPNGQIESMLYYEGKEFKNMVDGDYKAYHENGQLSVEFSVKSNELHGPYTRYHDNGNVYIKTTYLKGLIHGEFLRYFRNGKLDEKSNYKNGKLDKQSYEYYVFSDKYFTQEYVNGELHGEEIHYNGQNEPYARYTYKNGNVIEAKLFENTPNAIDIKNNGKLLTILPNYNEHGVLTYINHRDSEGKLHGETRNYYYNGMIKEVRMFQHGKRHGSDSTFYKDGLINVISTYDNDVMKGLYTSYNSVDGSIDYQGWVEDGVAVGYWTSYYDNGNLSRKHYQIHGDINGSDHNYTYEGKLSYTYEYDHGYITGYIQYDTLGEIIHKQRYDKDNQEYLSYYTSGQLQQKGSIVNGKFNGLLTAYSLDGKEIEIKNFAQGRLHGDYLSKNIFGMKQVASNYEYGDLQGKYEAWDFNGDIEIIAQYDDDRLDGEYQFFVGSELRYKYHYAQGTKNGKTYIYGDNQHIAGILHYENDFLIGYNQIGSDGKETAIIPLDKGNGKVTTTYPNGAKALEYNFVNSLYEGSQKIYYSNGQLAEERNFLNFQRDGAYVRYFPDGKLNYNVTYLKDELVGNFEFYNKNGQVVEQYTYVKGYKHGPAQFRDLNGNIRKATYHHGKMISLQ